MKVSQLRPNKEVAGYVDRVLVIEYHELDVPFSLPLFANGTPTLLFTSIKGKMGNDTLAYLTLFGQTILPATLTNAEGFQLIAYFFKPWALHTIFGIAAPELTDNPSYLGLLPLKGVKELEERLLNATTSDSRITLIDNYMAKLATSAYPDNRILQHSLCRIAQAPSSTILRELHKELHLTERTFHRMFEKNVGLSPGLYRRIHQFHIAFQQLNSRNFDKLSDIAFRNGYADQSHYIRTFKEFTDLTPKEYINYGSRS